MWLLLLGIFCTTNLPDQELKVYAKEMKDEGAFTELENLQIISYDATNNRSLAKITQHSANGSVCGNGVRLRNRPSTAAAVLELMYDGEYVWIDWSKYGRGEGGFSWYYVQRIKTGTYGWAASEYVGTWD